MNEFLRQFIMTGIRDMVDKGVALYQTYQYASGWFGKDVLTQEDLEEIDNLYKEKEQVEEQTIEEIEQLETALNSSEDTVQNEMEIVEEVQATEENIEEVQ